MVMTSKFMFLKSVTKFHHVTQTTLKMWSCEKKLITLAIFEINIIISM